MKKLEEVLKDWEAVIGLEVHAELTTLETKMFCGCISHKELQIICCIYDTLQTILGCFHQICTKIQWASVMCTQHEETKYLQIILFADLTYGTEGMHCASSILQILCHWQLRSVRSHFHDVGIQDPRRRHECRSARLSIS